MSTSTPPGKGNSLHNPKPPKACVASVKPDSPHHDNINYLTIKKQYLSVEVITYASLKGHKFIQIVSHGLTQKFSQYNYIYHLQLVYHGLHFRNSLEMQFNTANKVAFKQHLHIYSAHIWKATSTKYIILLSISFFMNHPLLTDTNHGKNISTSWLESKM